MPYRYRANCTKCDYGSDLLWLPWALYQRPSGHTFEVAQQLVWCPGCGKVTLAEYLNSSKTIEKLRAIPAIKNVYEQPETEWSPAEIEAVLGYTRYPQILHLHENVTAYKAWGARQAVMMRGALELHAQWRRTRKSLAHCLTCGSTRFTPLPVDDKSEPMDAKHPSCGGTLKFTNRTKVKRRPRPTIWTLEGKYVGESTA